MTMHRLTRAWVLGAALVFAVAGVASTQQRVSIRGELVNMRSQPSVRSEVLWQLGSGYPLEVLERRGSWLRVADFENDRGWVARRFTSTEPHVIVKSPRANLRAGPGKRHRIIGGADYGDVFRVLRPRNSWVQVQGEDGTRGWIARTLLWGL